MFLATVALQAEVQDFGLPRLLTKMLAGLMSRWMMPLECAASRRQQSGWPNRRPLLGQGPSRNVMF